MVRILLMTVMAVLIFNVDASISKGSEPWKMFHDEKTDLYGYIDANLNVRIPPKFILTTAYEFNNIMGVVEQKDKGRYQSYYLLKTGEKVGVDSLYMYDNSPDCECEGKIRFREKKKDTVGFFDSRGQVVIPAIYSDAHPFRNNLSMVLKDAKRICPDGEIYSSDKRNCEHFRWEGGQSYLIDNHHNILIDNFMFTNEIDWFSIRITEKEIKNSLRKSFIGKNGKYYSFVVFKKEFKHWLESVFLLSDNLESLKKESFEEITFWVDDKKEWKHEKRNLFLERSGKSIIQKINAINNGDLTYEIHKNGLGLNRFIFQGDLYSGYYDSCWNPKDWKYPVFNLVITYYTGTPKKEFLYQDVFEFLKTFDGYRLISLSLKSTKLK